MKKKRIVFILFALLAGCWTGGLAYQAYTVADPVVVSAPQLHFASLVVAAEVGPVHNGSLKARIVKVYKDELALFRQLPIEIQVVWPKTFPQPVQPTTYLLPLHAANEQANSDRFEIVPIPTPTSKTFLDPQVYLFTDSVRLQIERILKK